MERIRTMLDYRKITRIPRYIQCATFVSLGGFIFGFDTGSIGPITLMPAFVSSFGPFTPTVHGLIVSTILLPACLCSLFAGTVADKISRTYAISIGAIIFSIGSLLQCLSGLGDSGLPMFIVGRSIAGAGEGLFLSTVTVYTLEICPSHVRGRVASIVQLFITIGIAAGYFICYGAVRLRETDNMSWRIPFLIQACFSTLLAIGAPFLPHSPRWLLHVGRKEEALSALDVLAAFPSGTHSAEREKQELLLLNQSRSPQATSSGTETSQGGVPTETSSSASNFLALFAKNTRRQTFLCISMNIFQMTSGIDGVLYYAPVLFTQAGLTSQSASFLASGVSGLLNIACTIFAQIYTDKWGRRPTTIIGGAGISVIMLTIGTVYATAPAAGPLPNASKYLIIACIYLFLIAFATTWAVIIRIYVSEIQPMRTRALASSLGQSANWITNFLIAFTTPLFLARTSSGPYFFFGGMSVLSVLVYSCFMPETRGRTLESMEEAFEVSPFREFVRRFVGTARDAVGEVMGGGGAEGVELQRVEGKEENKVQGGRSLTSGESGLMSIDQVREGARSMDLEKIERHIGNFSNALGEDNRIR